MVGQGGGAGGKFRGPAPSGWAEVEAEAEDEVVDAIGIEAGLGQHAAGFAVVKKQVVGPFKTRGDSTERGDERADVYAHPEGESLHAGGLDAGVEGEAGVEVAVGGAVPGTPEAAAAFFLASGQDDERGPLAGGDQPGGLVVSAANRIEKIDAGASVPGRRQASINAGCRKAGRVASR